VGKVEATTGFEPVNRGFAGPGVASADGRRRRICAQSSLRPGPRGRRRPPVLLPQWLPVARADISGSGPSMRPNTAAQAGGVAPKPSLVHLLRFRQVARKSIQL
jgi:hypothetical protein